MAAREQLRSCDAPGSGAGNTLAHSTVAPGGGFVKLSVLDLVPVASNQTSASALAASMEQVVRADALGLHRYWFAEHHNMLAVASTAPAVLIALAGARTSRIRLGSGGVMLPNHAPLIVAEQFALLEAAFPGRVDLGLGRAPGSDPVVSAVLRSQGPTSQAERFPEHVADIQALLDAEGASVRLSSGEVYGLRATPAATGTPDLWLLGSSDFSARLAADAGLPYVFANHFAGTGGDAAMALYRGGFQPRTPGAAPRSFVTANVVVAESRAEAEELALPQLVQMARLGTGERLGPALTVEDAAEAALTPRQEEMVRGMRARWIIDEPAAAAERVAALADSFGVDEVMVGLSAGARRDDRGAAPARVRSMELLVDALGPLD